jgi:hypothetical protein
MLRRRRKRTPPPAPSPKRRGGGREEPLPPAPSPKRRGGGRQQTASGDALSRCLLPPLRFGEGGWGGGVAFLPPLRFGEGGWGEGFIPSSHSFPSKSRNRCNARSARFLAAASLSPSTAPTSRADSCSR